MDFEEVGGGRAGEIGKYDVLLLIGVFNEVLVIDFACGEGEIVVIVFEYSSESE